MSDYQIVTGDRGGVINVDTRLGAVSVTLPAPVSGFNVTIKDYYGNAANNIIIIQRSSDSVQIDGEVNDDIINQNYESLSYVSDGTNWFRVSSFTSSIAPTILIGGGFNTGGTAINNIDYILSSTLSSSSSFGTLTSTRANLSACSSSTRGVFGGGNTGSRVNTIDYVTIATLGNATSFGTLTVTRDKLSGCGSATRGLFGGGDTASDSLVIDYITIASTGNATSFGNLTSARPWLASCSSTTRGLFGGGDPGGVQTNIIDYVTIINTSNATSFGTLSQARFVLTSLSNFTRGIFAGGYNGSQVSTIDYVTIATTGNATSFGSLTAVKQQPAGAAALNIGLIAGGTPNGNASGAITNIDYIFIPNLSNAAAFGNLTSARSSMAGCSNSHGGL